MEGFFRPSLSTIISTAQAMLSRSGGADVIVLVGGFSASKFVRREMAAALEAGGGPPVVAPAYGATAVLEGKEEVCIQNSVLLLSQQCGVGCWVSTLQRLRFTTARLPWDVTIVSSDCMLT
jgi:hypothetical protein